MGPTEILVGGGVAALLAAAAGGGLKAFGVEVPALASVRRQVLLAVAGVALVAIGLFPNPPPAVEESANAEISHRPMSPPATPDPERSATAQADTRPEIPNIVDLPFPAARQFLIQNAWAPIHMGSPMANSNLGLRVDEIFDTGYAEAVSCSGSSLAPCLFRYRNPKGFILEVVTHGEQLTSAVVSSATIVDCSAEPSHEAC